MSGYRGAHHDVDVVAYAGTVLSGVVVTKDGQKGAPPHRHLLDKRHQVVRVPLWVLPNLAARVRPHLCKMLPAQYNV
eukprot:4708036-Pyramimonas_sp.AAC.1